MSNIRTRAHSSDRKIPLSRALPYTLYMPFGVFASALSEYKVFFLTAHILGTVLGLGGATIADFLFFRFLKDYKISAKECDVLNTLKGIILSALGLIIVSGVGLFLTDVQLYSSSGPFVVKMLIVGIITINGIALHLVVAPYLLRLDLKRHQRRHRRWRRMAFTLGAVSVCSWYSAFFIAMLKSVLPENFSILFGGYLVALMFALLMSQVIERRLAAQARG